MNEKEMQEFAAMWQAYQATKEQHTKTAGVSNSAQLLFGNTGLFTTQGLESDIITAYVRPEGISGYLAQQGLMFPSITERPVLGLITGIQDDGAAAVANPCDDAPTGYLKGCNIFAQFGRLQFDTATIEFDKIFTELNSGVNTDLRLRGRLLGLSEQDYPRGLTDDAVVNVVVGSEMVKVGMLMARGTTSQMGLTRQTWQGDPTDATAGGGYIPFPGLDSQITTGHVDATTSTTCPAVDSDVKNFNLALVSSNNANNVPNIVWYLSTMEYVLQQRARRMSLDPVQWAVVMREELWTELCQYWPIAYATNRGAQVVAGNVRFNVDAGVSRDEINRMKETMTIEINGRSYPVLIDDGIVELTNITTAGIPAGQYASSIYFVPLTINGGFPVTYMEYKDYRVGMAQLQALMGKQTFWTDGGTFSWALDPIRKWCFKMSAKTERRIVLRAPQLAGRVDNIRYAPLQHFTDNLPGSPYAVNGGVSTRAASTLDAVWN